VLEGGYVCQLSSKLIEIKKDTICYKVETQREGEWVTAYVLKKLKRNEILEIETDKDKDNSIPESVDRGYFHSFVNLEDAKAELYSWRRGKFRIVKCIIPLGTETLEGLYIIFDDSYKIVKTYASKKIIVTDEVLKER